MSSKASFGRSSLRQCAWLFSSGGTIDDVKLKSDRNNLTVTRLFLASAVILSHCKLMVLSSEADIFTRLTGRAISGLAVDGFFFLSGFLVYRSLIRRGDVLAFLEARIMRVWPALAVLVLVTVIGGLLCGGTLGAKTTNFIVNNLLLQSKAYEMDDIGVVNGSLWSIAWEVRCYLALAVLALLHLSDRRSMIAIIAISYTCAVLLHSTDVPDHHSGFAFFALQVDRLWTAFIFGIAAYIFRDKIRLSWSVCVLLFLILAASGRIGEALHLEELAVGYLVLCLGFSTGNCSSRWPDYSYGVYLYGFPIMMLLKDIWTFTSYLSMTAVTFLATIVVASISWHFVEKPALSLVGRRAGAWRRLPAEAGPPVGR